MTLHQTALAQIWILYLATVRVDEMLILAWIKAQSRAGPLDVPALCDAQPVAAH